MNVNYRRVLLPVITLFNTNNFNINIVNVINRFHELREKTWLSHDALVLSKQFRSIIQDTCTRFDTGIKAHTNTSFR